MLRALKRLQRTLAILLLVVGGSVSASLLYAADGPTKAIVVAQISDTHIGSERAPRAAENLRQIVEMVNERHPDVVIVTGDIGENTDARARARQILSQLTAKTYFLPGNHDATADTVSEWQREFGPDYYEFDAGGFTFLVLDSALLGSYESVTGVPKPLSPQGEEASKRMFDWLELRAKKKQQGNTAPIFVVQHVPLVQAEAIPERISFMTAQQLDAGRELEYRIADPFLTAQQPYAGRELELLHRMGIRHLFAGHWHWGIVFTNGGLTTHIAPSTGGPSRHPLGFALHTIAPPVEVRTSFIPLPASSSDSGTTSSTKPVE